MKKIILVLLTFCTCLSAHNVKAGGLGGEYELGDAINWQDQCFKYRHVWFGVMCGIVPTIMHVWTYWDPVALVEIVPDPWRSFLYGESFFDHEGRSMTGPLNLVGISPGIGSGYRGRKSSNGKENSGTERENIHVWAVSDFARLRTSNPAAACVSLTCKLEDEWGCLDLIMSAFEMGKDMMEMIDEIGSGEFSDQFESFSAVDMASLTDGIGEMPTGSGGYKNAMAWIDRITYANIEELMVQTVASKVPLGVYPIFMSERHQNPVTGGAAADGGIIMSPVYMAAGALGAGILRPVMCAAKNGISAAGEGISMVSDNMGSAISEWSNTINVQCTGWGPLEPRVTQIGTGDRMVASGIAGVRGFVVAQNLSKTWKKVLNPTPYEKDRFNLDWPHQSDCNEFVGPESLSRGWTSPLTSALGNIGNAVQSGDLGSLVPSGSAMSIAKDAVKGNAISKQGGQVFAYWRSRKCTYIEWPCDKWGGDTGL